MRMRGGWKWFRFVSFGKTGVDSLGPATPVSRYNCGSDTSQCVTRVTLNSLGNISGIRIGMIC
jgi:hypothetical protein